MTDLGDDDVIQAIVGRDPAALTTLYDRYGRIAFALAFRIVGDAGTAEEVVQDAFMRVWHHAATFDAARGGNARAWLLTIVHHRALDLRRLRPNRRHEVVGLEAVEEALAVPDVWGEVARRLEREQVRAAVDALPPEQRRAIELAYFGGLTHTEIAARTGAPLGTVKGRLRLGLQKLYASLVAVGVRRDEGTRSPSRGKRQPSDAASPRSRS